MNNSSLLLTCILVACTVGAVQGKCLDFGLEAHDQVEEETLADESVRVHRQLPGTCWICKWTLNKVKKSNPNATAEELREKLLSVCNEIGFLKSPCRFFVKKYLGTLIEELSTTDNVRMICVNVKACKPKEVLDLTY